ncbi:MAG: hypothetical protein ACWGO1_14120 [Anaerolineales bacterium]
MKKLILLLLVTLMLLVALIPAGALAATDEGNACWGQATAVFSQMGVMGEHASQQPTPRLGLRNLARALYDAGAIPDDSLQSLGSFVAAELMLSVDACMD